MRRTIFALCLLALVRSVFGAGLPVAAPESVGMDGAALARIDGLLRDAIHAGKAPGAVCIVGHNGRIVYRKAFGYAALFPKRRPMAVDTVFDLASLTKVTATAPSIMKLVEQGKLTLNATAAAVWPEYAANGKGELTIRQFLTHTAGLSSGPRLLPPNTPMAIKAAAPAMPGGRIFPRKLTRISPPRPCVMPRTVSLCTPTTAS